MYFYVTLDRDLYFVDIFYLAKLIFSRNEQIYFSRNYLMILYSLCLLCIILS